MKPMKATLAVFAVLVLAGISAPAICAGSPAPKPAPGNPRPVKLVLLRQSRIDAVEVMKNFSKKCPNVTFTENRRESDYGLVARGWPGGPYRFRLIAKGGDVAFTTETAWLSNSVKDVCHFLDSRQ